MEQRLGEKIAIVTGSGRGIGKAVALRLAEEGLLVTVNNQISAPNRILKANDRVSFIPHIGGG